MYIEELPMIIFTTVGQMSIGAFWMLGLIQLIGRRRGVASQTIDRVTNAGMYAAGPLLVLGFFAAFFHLNAPFHAPFTMLNLGSSWLSREIVFGVLYGLAGAICAIIQWFRIGQRTLRDVMAAVTALCGLGLLVSMIGVYVSVPTIPAWNWYVAVSFVATTLLLGSLAVGIAVSAAWHHAAHAEPASVPAAAHVAAGAGSAEAIAGSEQKEENDAGAKKKTRLGGTISAGLFPPGPLSEEMSGLVIAGLRAMTVLAAVAGAVVLIATPIQMAVLGLGGDVTNTVAGMMMRNGYMVIRLVLLVVTVAVLAYMLWRDTWHQMGGPKKVMILFIVAAIIGLISELMGRGLHYEGLIRVGINTVLG